MNYCACSKKKAGKLFEIEYENTSSSFINIMKVSAQNEKNAKKNAIQIKKPAKIRILSVKEITI